MVVMVNTETDHVVLNGLVVLVVALDARFICFSGVVRIDPY